MGIKSPSSPPRTSQVIPLAPGLGQRMSLWSQDVTCVLVGNCNASALPHAAQSRRPPERSEWEPRGSTGSGGLLAARCQPVALLLPHRVSLSPLGCHTHLGVCSQDPLPSHASFADAEYFRTRPLLPSLAGEHSPEKRMPAWWGFRQPPCGSCSIRPCS